MIYGAALVPLSLAPALMGMAGEVYFAGALVLGLAFLWKTFQFARSRVAADARRVFFGSILYLPLLWILMIANNCDRHDLPASTPSSIPPARSFSSSAGS